MDFTGCGNSLDLTHPRVLQMVMDSLRYWVQEMHVDGFRFDFTTTLAREKHQFDPYSGFLDAVNQDPVLSKIKLIAEPWDIGIDGYQLGNFPPIWAEWNDKFRDAVRRFWRSDNHMIGELASRLSGSSELFHRKGRRPWSSINFVTAHDGFTLHDLVSYDRKHNEANGEDNRDGTNANHSWNCGVEGLTTDSSVRALRERQKRNLMATLLLAQGAPMLVAGDEFGRTQLGNNNAYCQDNEISWVHWDDRSEDDLLLGNFVRMVLKLRRDYPVFRRAKFLTGLPIGNTGLKDVAWLAPQGHELTSHEWGLPFARCLGMEVYRDGRPRTGEGVGQHFLMLLNGHDGPVPFKLPEARLAAVWIRVFDTGRVEKQSGSFRGGESYPLMDRSFVVLHDR
jgi:glycogen operon protein